MLLPNGFASVSHAVLDMFLSKTKVYSIQKKKKKHVACLTPRKPGSKMISFQDFLYLHNTQTSVHPLGGWLLWVPRGHGPATWL